MPLLRLKLLKLQVSNRKLSKNRKTYLNTTVTLATHTPIIRTEGIRSHTVSLIVYFQDLLIGLWVLRGYIGKSI